MFLRLTFIIGFLSFLLISCGKKDKPEFGFQNITLDIELTSNGTPLKLNEPFLIHDGNSVKLANFKFFISNIYLIDQGGHPEKIKDVALFSTISENSSNSISGKVPYGSYTEIEFGLGLDSIQNASDPSSFDTDHPLSGKSGMYWDWMKYIFSSIAAEYITNTGTMTVAIHTGTDPVYSTYLKSLSKTMEVSNESSPSITLEIDLYQLFDGEGGTIDLTDNAQRSVHMDSTGDAQIAAKLLQNLAGATNFNVVPAVQ